jgi:lipopolysaccharide transport system ATP-binding protein
VILNCPVILCEEVRVRFPLVSPAGRWRLLLGIFANAWHEALSNVSVRVPHGKIVGVIGSNGAGKSTLLRTMAGVYPLSKGRVVRIGQVSALFELGGMGGLFITGKQYVLRWLRLNGVARLDCARLVEEIREFSELGARLDDRIYTYSAGMAARLYFSTVTSVGHDIYLIDEVLSVGDEHFQAKCWKRVRERLANGVSGVLVTHDWSAGNPPLS